MSETSEKRMAPSAETLDWLDRLTFPISIGDYEAPDVPLIYVNSSFERLTGYNRDSILGRSCSLLQCANTDPAALDQIKTALRSYEPLDVCLLNQRQDGSHFDNFLMLRPLDVLRQPKLIVGYQYDITKIGRFIDLRDRLREAEGVMSRLKVDSLSPFGQTMVGIEMAVEGSLNLIRAYHRSRNTGRERGKGSPLPR